jgi:hypothetical protein
VLRKLEFRIRALETRAPKEPAVIKEPLPAWLLDGWEEQGLRFDRSDVQSIGAAIELADRRDYEERRQSDSGESSVAVRTAQSENRGECSKVESRFD